MKKIKPGTEFYFDHVWGYTHWVVKEAWYDHDKNNKNPSSWLCYPKNSDGRLGYSFASHSIQKIIK